MLINLYILPFILFYFILNFIYFFIQQVLISLFCLLNPENYYEFLFLCYVFYFKE